MLPVAVLIAAGYGMVRYTGAGSLEGAAKSALAIVPGYAALALVVALLATHAMEAAGEEVTMAASTSDTILFAGILVPAVFAIVGALLATWPEPVDGVMAKVNS